MADGWRSVKMPTLVAVGGKSPAWMKHGMQELAGALPNAKLHTLDGQTHAVKDGALAPVLSDFFAS